MLGVKKFEYTSEGYIRAKEYLKSIGKLNYFENNYTSIDGYSLVAYANYCIESILKEQQETRF